MIIYQGEALYINSPKGLYIISSARNCISSARSTVSHQAAEDFIHAYGVMIYQAFGLDKKTLALASDQSVDKHQPTGNIGKTDKVYLVPKRNA